MYKYIVFKPKEKKIGVFPVTSLKKIRVGRSLLIFFSFSLFYQETHQMYEVYNEKGSLFGAIYLHSECMSYCKGIS